MIGVFLEHRKSLFNFGNALEQNLHENYGRELPVLRYVGKGW
jgi:hypothetical protein